MGSQLGATFVYFLYLGRLQKQLVEVYQVGLNSQQNAAVYSVASLETLSIHYTIHARVNKRQKDSLDRNI